MKNKKTTLAVLIAAIAALISAIVLVVVFWDKLLAFCPCKKKAEDRCCEDEEPEVPEEEPAEEAEPAYNEEELQDFADLEPAE